MEMHEEMAAKEEQEQAELKNNQQKRQKVAEFEDPEDKGSDHSKEPAVAKPPEPQAKALLMSKEDRDRQIAHIKELYKQLPKKPEDLFAYNLDWD